MCALCDVRSATRVLALDRQLAVCASCASGLRRDRIDLVDEEEGTEPTAPVPGIGPSRFSKTPFSAAEQAGLLRPRNTLKSPQNGAQEIVG